ncbi:methyltransferase domain-containing protein [Streptomonospora sediminis]
MTPELEQLLLESGRMSPAWRGAFRAVPRADFLPDVIWPFTGEENTPVDRRSDPEVWARWAEENVPITVQHDDGADSGPGVYTSSSSMPNIVAAMLGDLGAEPGMRVLEVGTGTGWNAALLSRRLGERAVTTVEVDPVLAGQARARLQAAGFAPAVVVGDGLHGHPPSAPYDRIIATMGVRSIPPAWIAQTRPGGVIVVPWGTGYSRQDAIARLVIDSDGAVAAGRFTRPAEFMKARAHRQSWPVHDDYVTAAAWPGAVSTADLALGRVFDPAYGGTGLLLGLVVDACTHTVHEGTAWLYGLTDRSWAAATAEHGRLRVHQSGPRRLWDEVEAAYRWWVAQGSPGVERFGLTATAGGRHQVWLEEPDHIVGFGSLNR